MQWNILSPLPPGRPHLKYKTLYNTHHKDPILIIIKLERSVMYGQNKGDHRLVNRHNAPTPDISPTHIICRLRETGIHQDPFKILLSLPLVPPP